MIQPGEKHYTATVFVISGSKPAKVLLHYHKKFGQWMGLGGHQEWDENPIEAAIRESREESGLDITSYIKPAAAFHGVNLIPTPDYFYEEDIPAHGDQPTHFHLDQIYVVRAPEQDVRPEAGESPDIGWFTLEEAEKLPMFDNVRVILRRELTA